MPIHRSIKNVVKNYTEAERKVREATSNDPWGPSSTLMAEIADMTHNVMAFTEIMQMIWKRLNDKNKNWRHVYKAMVLLEYVIKTGSEKVAVQCRENLHSIETLKDFQYVEENKDYGMNVREKAKLLVALLRDEEKLGEERGKAIKAKERLAQHPYSLGSTSSSSQRVAFGRGPSMASRDASRYHDLPATPAGYGDGVAGSSSPQFRAPPVATNASGGEIDSVRPQSEGEEQLQLQLAMAMSKEEHDKETKKRQQEVAKEEAKVKMALEQSRREEEDRLRKERLTTQASKGGGLFQLVDTSLSAAPASLPDPWSAGNADRTVARLPPVTQPPIDPWGDNGLAPNETALGPPTSSVAPPAPVPIAYYPWESGSVPSHMDNRAGLNQSPLSRDSGASGGGTWDMQPMGKAMSESDESEQSGEQLSRKKSAADFLGEHGGLVDLEKLVQKHPTSTNPFATTVPQNSNPFAALQPPKVPLNKLAGDSKQAFDHPQEAFPPPLVPPPTQPPVSTYQQPNPWSPPPPPPLAHPASMPVAQPGGYFYPGQHNAYYQEQQPGLNPFL